MLKNADVTFYSFADYSRHTVGGVYWFDARGKTHRKNGIEISDSIVVYLYDDSYIPKAGDVFVKGICDFAFVTTSDATISASMNSFRTQHPDFAVVKSVSDCRFGGLPHIEITAR